MAGVGAFSRSALRLAGALGARLAGLYRSLPQDRYVRPTWRRFARALGRRLPKGLYARSLIIIVAPIVLLQAALAFVFMERHWQHVTQRLSAAVSSDIAALISLYEAYPSDSRERLTRIAERDLGLNVEFLPAESLPPPSPQPFFSVLDRALSDGIDAKTERAFWIDTVGRSDFVEIRIALDDTVMRVVARRSQTYASNSHIFLVWMVSIAFLLIAVSMIFLRNQIRPIQRLAEVAERFGRGQSVPAFRPRGAREVRQAAQAFNDMRERIERHVEQRTAMLAGVSHDLRTVLTRFRLELAMLDEGADTDALRRDVDDMQDMLEGYLAFVRGAGDEETAETDLVAVLRDLAEKARRHGVALDLDTPGELAVRVRPMAFRRMLDNLVTNAARHGEHVRVAVRRKAGSVEIAVDDDGPGVPAEARESVFRPFVRLDDARNQDVQGTGLGLTIARDIARNHGGDIVLENAPLGGLRARLHLPA